MAFWISKKKDRFLWDVQVPDLKEFIGRFVKVKDDEGKELVIEIERIVGSVAYANKLQVEAKEKAYLISMLDFFAQMNGETVTPEEIKLFDETMFSIQQNDSIINPRGGFKWKRKKGLWTN